MRLEGAVWIVLLSAAFITPACANWFDGALQYGGNHKKLIGSALTPTPDDLRAVGDSSYGSGKNYDFDEKTGHWREIRLDQDTKGSADGASAGEAVRHDGAAKNATESGAGR